MPTFISFHATFCDSGTTFVKDPDLPMFLAMLSYYYLLSFFGLVQSTVVSYVVHLKTIQ